MQTIFSAQNKYSTWRRLWLALAKAEKKIGLPITSMQIEAMQSNIDTIDFTQVAKYEKIFRHDVMAHLHAFADDCPSAKGIIHMGATSTFVTDNTDIIQMQAALKLLKTKCVELIRLMKEKAQQYATLPTLGYTHLQPAQTTTVGKRICLWLQDFLLDTHDLIEKEESLCFLGLKGATGTQASFMQLLDHDESTVEKLDHLVAQEMGFKKLFIICGQTYTRKQDMRVLSVLEAIGASSHKCGTDLRLLSHFGEIEEGRKENQIGSSAMPHKCNPILSERICGLSRFLISICQNPSYTHATQWLERSLDDSANRRIVIPDSFLAADAILNLLLNIFSNLSVNKETIEKNLSQKLPFLALENILMCAVKHGKDRQEVHEKLRKDPLKGKEIAKSLGLTPSEIKSCFEPDSGRAKEQVTNFLKEQVNPLLEKCKALKAPIHNINV